MRFVCIYVHVLFLAAIPACAQNVWSFEARSLAMGNAVVAVANDSAAWLQNPAGLPYLQARTGSDADWPARVIAVGARATGIWARTILALISLYP